MSTDIIGYCAVVLPREGEYQGFYLRQEETAEGQAALDRAVTGWREAMGVHPTAQELAAGLAARDPDAARLEIRALPAVRLIELNLALQKLLRGGE